MNQSDHSQQFELLSEAKPANTLDSGRFSRRQFVIANTELSGKLAGKLSRTVFVRPQQKSLRLKEVQLPW